MAANSPSPRACVIGAGPCGLTTVKNLLAEGIDFVCYEEAQAVGGNWVYDDSSDRRSVYKATRLISSKRFSEFEDFPMPDDYPDFPSHRQMLDYFNAYAAATGKKDIEFPAEVRLAFADVSHMGHHRDGLAGVVENEARMTLDPHIGAARGLQAMTYAP